MAKLVADGLLITDVAGHWEVWCGAEGENIINAHLIGLADTKAEAIENAIAETKMLLKRLKAQREKPDEPMAAFDGKPRMFLAQCDSVGAGARCELTLGHEGEHLAGRSRWAGPFPDPKDVEGGPRCLELDGTGEQCLRHAGHEGDHTAWITKQ